MAIQEGLLWAKDDERLYYRFLAGFAQEKNPLILLHGHGEHSGRYLKFFSSLQDMGFSIGTFDFRGCGLSSGEPAYVNCFEDYLADVTHFLGFLETRFKVQGPIQLFGHSMGGLVATMWAVKHPEKVSKLILSSPLFGIPKQELFKGLIKILNSMIPGFVIKNPVQPFCLTHDAREIEEYKKDELIRKRITVRLVHEMLKCISILQTQEISVPFPVYILMAEKDYVVSPQATRKFFEKLRAPQKEIESFPGFFHEIFNESEQARVFGRLKHYLSK